MKVGLRMQPRRKIGQMLMFPQYAIRKFLVRVTFYGAIAVHTALTGGCVFMLPTDPYSPVPRSQSTSLIPQVTEYRETAAQPVSMHGPLTIATAIQTALANNPEIAASQWDVAAAEAKLDAVRAARWPAVSVEGGLQHFLDDQRLIPARYNGEPGIFDRDLYRADLVAKMPLFTGGRITGEIHAAELLRLAEEKRLVRSREELIFNVSSTFYAMLSQREVIRSLEFSTAAMEEHRRQVSDLLAAQKAARVDLLRTEVRLADLRQGLERERNTLAVLKRLLVNLMGVDDETEQIDIEGELLVESARQQGTEDMMQTALLRRGDYLSAQARLEAQASRVDAAKAGYWPTLSLLASYGGREAGSGESEDAGVVGLGASVPLFEGGRTSAQVRQERAVLAASQERLRKLKLQIRQEVETAALEIRSSEQRISAVSRAVEQAKESMRIERMKYDLGSGSLIDVLDAQSALLQSETNYARVLADYHIAMAKLKLATGEDSL